MSVFHFYVCVCVCVCVCIFFFITQIRNQLKNTKKKDNFLCVSENMLAFIQRKPNIPKYKTKYTKHTKKQKNKPQT